MASPRSTYQNYSADAKDYLNDYEKRIKDDSDMQRRMGIIAEFGEQYERSYQLLNTFYAQAYKDLSYYLGNQWSLEELSYLNNQRRSTFTYNKIRRLINLVQGYQRKNRLAIKISPIEDASEDTANLMTDVIQYIMQTSDGYETISQAFKGAITSGVAFISPYVDYRNDPVSGDIRFHLDEWNSVIFDPFFTKMDLSDCSFMSRRKFLSRTEVVSLIPDKEDLIMSLPYGNRDDKFTYMPYARQWGMQKLMNYTEYYRPSWEMREVLVDMETGETREWKGDRARFRLFKQAFPQIEIVKKPVRIIEMGIIVEGELVYYGKDPFGLDDYPFVPVMAIFEPSYDLYDWKIQSLVRILRDPQTELNKRRSKMVDILDSQLNSGWVAKNGAVSNPTSLYKSGQGQVIFLKDTAQMTDLQRLESPGIHPSMFQLEAEFEKDMFEIIGLSPENVGQAENDKVETAGILAKQRQAAGWIPMQDIFDNLRQSQKILGRKIMKLIQRNYTPEKVALITKKKPTQEFYSKIFARYDVAVEEGALTDTQKQSEFITLTALSQMGILPPEANSLILKKAPIHDRKELQDILEAKAESDAQMQQAQMQQVMQQQEIVTQSMSAKAESDQALAAERMAKIQLDQALNAERISRAEEDRTAGVLNLIKAVKELEQIDLESLGKKLELLRQLEGEQRQEEVIREEELEETLLPLQRTSQSTTQQP